MQMRQLLNGWLGMILIDVYKNQRLLPSQKNRHASTGLVTYYDRKIRFYVYKRTHMWRQSPLRLLFDCQSLQSLLEQGVGLALRESYQKHLGIQNFQIKNMTSMTAPLWQQVTYSPQNSSLPIARWGHRMVRISPSQALLFGGFGGESSEGKYLDDLWEFNLQKYEWKRLTSYGEIPQKRSNYTIHYDDRNDQVILFGGGALNKLRYNSIHILDIKSMTWRVAEHETSEEAPWQRTYHGAEFSYPFLIVYGGEGFSNMDLDDCWTFNIQTSRWTKIEFSNNNDGPKQRRFHSTALIGTHFYVIGGCKDNYQLLGDMHRVDLKGLFEQNKTSQFTWEKIIKNNRSLEKWGHSSDVYNNKIYLFAGRISATTDTSDMFVFDPTQNSLKKMQIKDKSEPKPRRRHASLIVGSSLLCFGGYNGKYLNDFYFITLPAQTQPINLKTNIIITENYEDFTKKIKAYEKKIKNDWQIQVKNKQGSIFIATNKELLLKNKYFFYLYSYSGHQKISIQLPSFCSIDMFRFLHIVFIEGDAVFCKKLSNSFYFNLIDSLEYFICSRFVPTVQQYLLTKLSQQNCAEMLSKAIESGLNILKFKAAELLLKKTSFNIHQINLQSNICTSNNFVKKQQDMNFDQKTDCFIKTLKQVQELLKFEIYQTHLRNKNPKFFTKTAQSLKRIFLQTQQAKSNKQISEKQQRGEPKKGCFAKIIDFFSKIAK